MIIFNLKSIYAKWIYIIKTNYDVSRAEEVMIKDSSLVLLYNESQKGSMRNVPKQDR